MKRSLGIQISVLCLVVCALGAAHAESNCNDSSAKVPADVKAVFDKPVYKNAVWGLRIVDLDTGKELMDLQPHCNFYIGSVRKVFTVGQLLNQVGPTHRYNTPVYRQGELSSAGVLHGNLVLVASGDLTMGGRTNPNGTVAITNFDHNEADSLGNATLATPNPLAGYIELARQVAKSSVKEVSGNVIIDDRLFQPFNFRGQFDVRPIFVNGDLVDLSIRPTSPGQPASVSWRPVSAALGVENKLMTSGRQSKSTIALDPVVPLCIGKTGCRATINGQIPIDFVPPLTNKYPLVQAFRITQPSNYARTIFIEALKAAGVKIHAAPVAENPAQQLPAKGSYTPDAKLAELKGLPYSETAKLILKVSYNIGADTSLVLYGLTQGVDNMSDALRVERKDLATNYGIAEDEYHFVDGSGGGPTTAINRAVTKMLIDLKAKPSFPVFFNDLPKLGVDGSLGFVTDFKSDPTLAGATGRVTAKTGTFVHGDSAGLMLKGQAFGGYITTRQGKHLVYELVVNNVVITSLDDVLRTFQDEGRISAMLWRDN
ncbi:MAG: D-alanyl-D-alanine carboxypeptidase [Acidobacteriaceae bacterium]|jgi:D-alanyl-D-alanine carboxypeptidase